MKASGIKRLAAAGGVACAAVGYETCGAPPIPVALPAPSDAFLSALGRRPPARAAEVAVLSSGLVALRRGSGGVAPVCELKAAGAPTALRAVVLPFEADFFKGVLEVRTPQTPAGPEPAGVATAELLVRGTFTREVAGPLKFGGRIATPLVMDNHLLRSAAKVMCWLLPMAYDGIDISRLDVENPYLTADAASVLDLPAAPFRPGTEYVLRGWSRNIDLEQWAVVGLPGFAAMPLAGWWGSSPLTVYFYVDTPAGRGDRAEATVMHTVVHGE